MSGMATDPLVGYGGQVDGSERTADSNLLRFQLVEAPRRISDKAILQFGFHRRRHEPQIPESVLAGLPQDTTLQRAFVSHLRSPTTFVRPHLLETGPETGLRSSLSACQRAGMSLRFHEITEADHRILNPLTDAKLMLLGELSRVGPATRILDLACGNGEMLCRWAAAFGSGGHGVDLSEVFLAAARDRAEQLAVADRVTFDHGDAGTYAAQPQSYDIASCLGRPGSAAAWPARSS